MAVWLMRVGAAIAALGGVLMTPEAFSDKAINRGRKRVKRAADKVSVLLKYIGWSLVGGLVLLALSLATAASDPDTWFFVVTPKQAQAVGHFVVVVGLVVPAASLAAAIVAGLLFFVLWLLAGLLWLATSKRKRLRRTGGILFLVGSALGLGATFLPQPASQPSERRPSITRAKRVGSLWIREPCRVCASTQTGFLRAGEWRRLGGQGRRRLTWPSTVASSWSSSVNLLGGDLGDGSGAPSSEAAARRAAALRHERHPGRAAS
jgi:hypothetical protein